ncbi:MAG: 5-dehydro-4-deoxy-D-glucuronate isomerase [Saprospiraceae bacterium]
MNYELRYAAHPDDVKGYDTTRLRKEFAITTLMKAGEINLIYSLIDRYITMGAVPTSSTLKLETIDFLKSDYFLERREIGVINVGGSGTVVADGTSYHMKKKEALYLGRGTKDVMFSSDDANNPAVFYINSTPAHKTYPSKLVTLADAEIVHLGSQENSNERQINKLLVNSVVTTCQLQMGMTEMKKGSVWNTMPAHVHNRRSEVYFYFDLDEKEAVCHLMGEPQETRHLWLHNHHAAISPSWSIHSGAATGSYTFIWGMAGENLDYGDMDKVKITELK